MPAAEDPGCRAARQRGGSRNCRATRRPVMPVLREHVRRREASKRRRRAGARLMPPRPPTRGRRLSFARARSWFAATRARYSVVARERGARRLEVGASRYASENPRPGSTTTTAPRRCGLATSRYAYWRTRGARLKRRAHRIRSCRLWEETRRGSSRSATANIALYLNQHDGLKRCAAAAARRRRARPSAAAAAAAIDAARVGQTRQRRRRRRRRRRRVRTAAVPPPPPSTLRRHRRRRFSQTARRLLDRSQRRRRAVTPSGMTSVAAIVRWRGRWRQERRRGCSARLIDDGADAVPLPKEGCASDRPDLVDAAQKLRLRAPADKEQTAAQNRRTGGEAVDWPNTSALFVDYRRGGLPVSVAGSAASRVPSVSRSRATPFHRVDAPLRQPTRPIRRSHTTPRYRVALRRSHPSTGRRAAQTRRSPDQIRRSSGSVTTLAICPVC